jgi:predicted nuclease of predicted toxin-antitoxin system
MAKIEFYFDEMMPRDVAKGLAARDISVTMAVDVEMVEKDDLTEHLTYAEQRGLVLVTRDKPFATKALSIEKHAGVICWTGEQNDVGGMIRRLTEFAQERSLEQVANGVFWVK